MEMYCTAQIRTIIVDIIIYNTVYIYKMFMCINKWWIQSMSRESSLGSLKLFALGMGFMSRGERTSH